jgi:coproporphyrinogen III oxidase-like Fe-S oxidoreductase
VHTREPRRYLADPVRSLTHKVLALRDLPFEFMLNALRLVDGFETELFERRTGLAWDAVEATMEELRELGLVGATGDLWRPTRMGIRFLNDVLLRFLPEPGQARSKMLSRPFEAESRAGA